MAEPIIRDLESLHPVVREKAERLVALCKAEGLSIHITETLRTEKRQDELYAKGRDADGNIIEDKKKEVVTYAKGSAYSSMHQWGLAFDFCRNYAGRQWDNSDKFFDKVGKIGESIGLTWGGGWRPFADLPHFEDRGIAGDVKALKAKFGGPEKFVRGWGV